MPNFFKKLTGSLQMPDDDELFQDDLKENEGSENEVKNYSSKEEFTQSENVDEEEEEETDNPDGTEETPDDLEVDEEEEETSPETELETPTEEEEGSSTYTIAQLAQATTAKRVAPTKAPTRKGGGALSKLKKSLSKKETVEENPEPEGQLAIDVFETPSDIVIKSTIAGVKAEDLDVGIDDNVVNIRGSRHRDEKVEDVDYFYQECYWGTFSRSVILPVEVDTDKAQASLSNGVLTVLIPKIQKEKEKKIKVLG